MGNVIIDRKLIAIGLDINNNFDGIRYLSQKLFESGYVEDGFCESVIDREKVFPTGLPTVIPVALCHTDAKFVKESTLAVATLKQPVTFVEMGSEDEKLDVEVIFMLALKDPKDQSVYLKKMMSIFRKQEFLSGLKTSTNVDEIYGMLSDALTGE